MYEQRKPHTRVSIESDGYAVIGRAAHRQHGPATLTKIRSPAIRSFNADVSGSSWRLIDAVNCRLSIVLFGRHKPPSGQHDVENTTGQTRLLSTVLSTTDVMSFTLHIHGAKKLKI